MKDETLIVDPVLESVEEITPEETQAEVLTKAVREDRNAMPYQSASSCIPLGAVVPTKLSFETVEALNRFKQNGIDTAEFVREKLGYPSRIAVCDAFAAEQVDAIALAVVQIEKEKGFILGDAAGIGKGRVCAGIQRYAKHIGKIPVFITIGPSLFSDMYRDIEDTGSYWSDGQLPEPFIFNEDGIVQKIEGENAITLYQPLKTKETVAFCLKNKMPDWADVVFLTYSQLSQDITNPENRNQIAKYNFLKAIAPDAIFILDESHKGAGDGNIGQNLTSLLELSAGVMFASATYSKVPKSMMLYIPKTDIADSKIRPDTIVDAVAENGEVIQEYIASLLVKSGQMIRRERTFDKCKIEYEYMHYGEKEKYYKLYDDVMGLFNEIEEFTKSTLYKDAVKRAIARYCVKKNIVLVDEDDRKRPTGKTARMEWEERNEGKYLVSFPTTLAVKNRFQWIENLLFAIKADYVAAQAIKLLKTNTKKNERGEIVPNVVEYTNYETKEKYFVTTNYKPIVAIRNTAESALHSLGYKIGDKLTPEENDYAKTLIRIAENLMVGNLIFTQADELANKIVIEGAYLEYTDYSDGGGRFRELVKKMKGATSGLPLSPIDHMINQITQAQRAEWDYQYVSPEQKTFRVEEITKRSMALRPRSDGKPGVEVFAIEKETVTDKVGRFNSGQSDVIILNTAGATGVSMHSSHKFVDRRPRTMLIHQVELDVNTEVQKRGRTNRTGQINYPGYTYIVSMIPSEVRKLMMLRRKLRSLDANTTGNVKQSAKASEILDAEGRVIEDMSNRYGYEALTIFVQEPQNEIFLNLMDGGAEWFNNLKGDPDDRFDAYLREVEKLPCVEQERFYNDMNVFYSILKKQKEEAGEWDLETAIEDIKTSTINKKVLFVGLNTNEFSKSVYIEDKFATPRGVPFENKEALKAAEVNLAETDDFTKYHNDLIDSFDADTKHIRDEIIVSHGEPDYSNAKTKEEREIVLEEHEERLAKVLEKADERSTITRNHIITLKPNAPFQIPYDSDQFVYFDQSWQDQNGDRKSNIEYIVGVFVGYRFLAKSGNKWSPMNIELVFATTSRLKPLLKLTLTKQYEDLLNWIITGTVSAKEVAIVREWVVKKKGERDKIRVLTGEIFKAFEITKELFKDDENYKERKKLMKYSTTSGGVETGIRLWQLVRTELTKGRTPTFAPINSKEFQDIIDKQEGDTIWLPSNKEFVYKYNGQYKFAICTGLHGRGKAETKKPNKNYLSAFATTDTVDAISQQVGVKQKIESLDLTMHMQGDSKHVTGMKFFVFDLNKSQFTTLLNYLYSKYFITIELSDKSDAFIMSNVKDTYVEKAGPQDESGEFQYYPLLKFDQTDLTLVPPNYVVGSYAPSLENENGIITLTHRLSPVQAALFHVVPANISEGDAVANILKSIADDNTRLEYVKRVKELGDHYLEIAIYTQQQIGVSPKYAVGKVDDIYAAEVIARNIDTPTDTKVKVQKSSAKEKVPVSWDSIQDFIIALKSL